MEIKLDLSEMAVARTIPDIGKVREQSGCIPYRVRAGKVEVLLIKKKTKQAWWGFCKGGLESHLNKRDNAAKECYEESGITGTVTKNIGKFEYKKDGKRQIVYMYAMEFHTELDNWPEKRDRKRRWCSMSKARKLLSAEHHKFLVEIQNEADKKAAKRKA